jgi:hypothetical protein
MNEREDVKLCRRLTAASDSSPATWEQKLSVAIALAAGPVAQRVAEELGFGVEEAKSMTKRLGDRMREVCKETIREVGRDAAERN